MHRADKRTPITMRKLLEWTYAQQKPHLESDSGVGAIGYSPVSQTGAVLDRLRLGCQVSGGGGLRHARYDHDALVVHGLVLALGANERALIIRHAELLSAPNWSPTILPFRCVPVPGNKGRPKGSYDRHGNRLYSMVTFEGDWPSRDFQERAMRVWRNGPSVPCAGVPKLRCADEVVNHARLIYSRWYSALAAMCDDIKDFDHLRRWRITDIGAERTPWQGPPTSSVSLSAMCGERK